MGRRANGEGSIYKTSDGRWRGFVTVGTNAGKQVRKYRAAKTRNEVLTKLNKLKQEHQTGRVLTVSRATVRSFMESWLTEHIAAHKSRATEALYRSISENHIFPKIGDHQLQKLSPANVQTFVDKLATDIPSAHRTRQLAYDVLLRAIRHAIKTREIAENPMGEIDRPSYEEEEIFPFTPDEAAELFAESKGTRVHVAVVLGIAAGLRIGEILGLPVAEIDLSGKQVRIAQQAAEVRGTVEIRRPKTKSSVRTIQLPDVAIDAINSHRVVLLKEGLAGSELLLPAREGGPERRTNFARRDWKPLLKRLDIEPRGFHHTRHTYATLALGAGVPVHVVSKVMGHKKPSTTLNIYAHALKGQQDQATQAMNLLFVKTA